MSGAAYDGIGRSYAATRVPDPRIAARLDAALGDVASVVNIGAGTGAYEPPQTVLAVEPSVVMLAQRAPGAAPAVQASAEALPLEDDAADAALAVLTIHHWRDVEAGMAELRRVARRRVVVLTWDQEVSGDFWLMRDYLRAATAFDRARAVPIARLVELLGDLQRVRVETVPIPHDCSDGFLAAYWRRPEAYLDAAVRAGMSALAQAGEVAIAPGLARLSADLASGAWHERHADLLARDEMDCGYRLLVADL